VSIFSVPVRSPTTIVDNVEMHVAVPTAHVVEVNVSMSIQETHETA